MQTNKHRVTTIIFLSIRLMQLTGNSWIDAAISTAALFVCRLHTSQHVSQSFVCKINALQYCVQNFVLLAIIPTYEEYL
jgi:hypothetical protein